MSDFDELDGADVRERLAELKRRGEIKRDIQAALGTPDGWFDAVMPLPEGGEGAPLDPWGRGPGSPFYSPRPGPDDDLQRRWDDAWRGPEEG